MDRISGFLARIIPAAAPTPAVAATNQGNVSTNSNNTVLPRASTVARRAVPLKRQWRAHGWTAIKSNNPNFPRTSAVAGMPALPRKKKKTGHGWTKKKSHKPAAQPAPPAPLGHPDNYNFDRRRFYKIQGIMADKGRRYLIRWAGNDSQGGPFLDTWVPKSYANRSAVDDWKARREAGKVDEFNDSDDEEKSKTKKSKKAKAKAGGAKAKGKKSA